MKIQAFLAVFLVFCLFFPTLAVYETSKTSTRCVACTEDPISSIHCQYEFPEDQEKDEIMQKNRRLLGFTVDDPTFIPFDTQQSNSHNAYQHVFRHLSTHDSRFLVYPYEFELYGSQSGVNASYPNGAVVDLKTIEDDKDNPFSHIQAISNITLGRSKALYKIGVAILAVEGVYSGKTRDLFPEAFTFCTALSTYTGADYSCVYVTEKDIQAGYLVRNGGALRFGILLVSDIYTGAQDTIISLLQPNGTNHLLNYVARGGTIMSSAKGALVLQQVPGLIPEDTFDEELVVAPPFNGLDGAIDGCDQIDDDADSWAQKILCFSTPTKVNFLSAPVVKNHSAMEVISSFNTTTTQGMRIRNTVTGLDRYVTLADGVLPNLLYKNVGRGHVVVHLGHPIFRPQSYPFFYNTMFLAMSRPLILNTKLGASDGKNIIPGLEQVSVHIEIEIKNTFDAPLNITNYIIWIAEGTKLFGDVPEGCELFSNSTSTPPHQDLSRAHLNCAITPVSFPAFGVMSKKFSIHIVDVLITQKRGDVVMVYPVLNYTVPSGKWHILDYGSVTVDAMMAASIRTDCNPDPVGHYPVKGKGNYVDTVIWAENKEATPASDVSLTLLVPLISPLVDGVNQGLLTHTLDLDHLYYKKDINNVDDYNYPLGARQESDPRDYDFLDWRTLGARGDLLIPEWDESVKLYKELRYSSVFGNDTLDKVNVSDIHNSGFQTNIDTDEVVLRQTYFGDSDSFFEHGTQRLMAFVDTSEEKGFKSYNRTASWSGGMPSPDEIHPNGKTMKRNYVFVRNDIYFYDCSATGCPLPDKAPNNDAVFSIDRYSPLSNSQCEASFGDAKAEPLVSGYFDSNKTTTFPPGLKPHEYSHELLSHCSRLKGRMNLTDFQIDGHVLDQTKMTHYIVRLTENEIQSGDDMRHFKKDVNALDDEWYYAPGTLEDPHFGDYPELKFKYAFGGDFSVSSSLSRAGGKLNISLPGEIQWPTSYDVIGNESITIAADKIAITNIDYDPPSHSVMVSFMRGNMPNENYGLDSNLAVNLEGLSGTQDFDANITLYELIHSFSDSRENSTGGSYQEFINRPEFNTTVRFKRIPCLSFPMMKLVFRRQSKYTNESYIQPYEFMEPFARVGNYMQELRSHSTVWGSLEAHLHSDPGYVGKSSGFMWIAGVGTSSIPFRQYLTTGKQMIPAAPETSRIEWNDIWGRQFAQPIRSNFVDVPPIPPPVRNFVLTTSFELLDPTSGKRVLQWRSDDTLLVRVHMKLLNSYPKWFEITTCKENQVLQLAENGNTRPRLYFGAPANTNVTDLSNTKQFIKVGHESFYGKCLKDAEVYLNGTKLDASQRNLIANAQHCFSYSEGCEGLQSLPTISKRPQSRHETIWNFAQQVKSYWPKNYTSAEMWDLTHYDYDDTPFDKAYKYHMDNHLPSVDKSQDKPHNIIAYPLYKGLGYSLTYSKETLYPRNSSFRGWWSDNLQNRDGTVVAGQETSNDISVGASDLTDSVGWVPIVDLDVSTSTPVQRTLKNIYGCEFNRHRVKVDPSNSKATHPTNILQNNVVPIDPTLTKWDERLTEYECDLSQGQYTQENISQFDNILHTQTARDWLYFAANLRGGAKETLNVVTTLSPIGRREGMIKVQDGARFVYWNPCCGPNAFLVMDAPVSIVEGRRTDIDLSEEILPLEAPTFDAVVFHLVRMYDEAEIERYWNSPIYINHYGFGDSTVSVYVGGVEGTESNIRPGETTYAKIEFFNNAGFDWNLLMSGINSTVLSSKPINAYDLMKSQKHSIQVPTAYNFMTVTPPAELLPYLDIVPSDHNVDVAPQFFDFSNINVASIRDGYKGMYYYKIKLDSSLPAHLIGRVYELTVTLHEEYFDRLPSFNDPTGLHDYHLQIPSIMISIPFGTNVKKEWMRKAFYTSGYSHDLTLTHLVSSEFDIQGAVFVNESQIDQLRVIASDPIDRDYMIESYWRNITQQSRNCTVTKTPYSTDLNTVLYNGIGEVSNKFPYPITQGPDEADVYLLLKTYAHQLAVGWNMVSAGMDVGFLDSHDVTKNTSLSTRFSVHTEGAWLELSYKYRLLSKDLLPLDDQVLRQEDAVYVETSITALNIGTDVAYSIHLSAFLAADVNVATDLMTTLTTGLYTITMEDSGQVVHIDTGVHLPPGDSVTRRVYVLLDPMATYDPERQVIIGVNGEMELTPVPGEKKVTQIISQPLTLSVSATPRPTAALEMTCTNTTLPDSSDSHSCKLSVTENIEQIMGAGMMDNATFAYFRRADENEEWTSIIEVAESTTTHEFETKPTHPDLSVIYIARIMRGSALIISTNSVIYKIPEKTPIWWPWLVGGLILFFALLLAAWFLRKKCRRGKIAPVKIKSMEMSPVKEEENEKKEETPTPESPTTPMDSPDTDQDARYMKYFKPGATGWTYTPTKTQMKYPLRTAGGKLPGEEKRMTPAVKDIKWKTMKVVTSVAPGTRPRAATQTLPPISRLSVKPKPKRKNSALGLSKK